MRTPLLHGTPPVVFNICGGWGSVGDPFVGFNICGSTSVGDGEGWSPVGEHLWWMGKCGTFLVPYFFTLFTKN